MRSLYPTKTIATSMNTVEQFRIIEVAIRKMVSSYGFLRCSSTYFRRYKEKTISCLYLAVKNRPSSNRNTDKPFGLCLNFGIHFKCVKISPIKIKNNLLEPDYSDCLFRKTLPRRTKSAWGHDSDIWTLADGESPEQMINEIESEFTDVIIPWFEEFESLDNSLKFLLNQREDFKNTFGMGALPSPLRSISAASIAYELGYYQSVRDILLNAGPYLDFFENYCGADELFRNMQNHIAD